MAFSMTAMASAFVCTAVVLLTAMPMEVAAQNFLEPDCVSSGRVVEQLRSMMGPRRDSERIQRVEGLLKSTYMTLPQDARGTLDHRAARYALHRYFLVEHGWHIKGLSSEVDVRDVPSTAVLKSRVPDLIMELLKKQLGSDRMALEDLALVAASIHDLVDSDSIDLLEVSYRAHQLATEDSVSTEEAGLVMRTFLLLFLMPEVHAHIGDRELILYLANGVAGKVYPGWADTVRWVNDLKGSLEYQDHIALQPFAALDGQRLEFSSVARWATAVSAGAGLFTNMECKQMRGYLMEQRDVDYDGRVSLANFYVPHETEERWSPAYLRHVGALDEHNPRQPTVIVPNLVYARSNCLSTFGFQSICCIDSCEVLMAELETHTLRPAAAPALIAGVVSEIPSETVAAPRNLSAQLLSRLDDLAGRHGGSVPLHSRLFAQWMHYAFPNECPLPRSLFTSEAVLSAAEWRNKTKLASRVSQQEVDEATELMSGNQTPSSEVSAVPWSDDEELLSELPGTDRQARGRGPSVLRAAAVATIFVATVAAISGAAPSSLGKRLQRGGGKHSDFPLFDA